MKALIDLSGGGITDSMKQTNSDYNRQINTYQFELVGSNGYVLNYEEEASSTRFTALLTC